MHAPAPSRPQTAPRLPPQRTHAARGSLHAHRGAPSPSLAGPQASVASARPPAGCLRTPAGAGARGLPAPRLCGGFGLIDAMLALLVIGLVFGIALPAWNGFVSRSHATAARAALSASLFDAMRESSLGYHSAVVCPDGGGVCAGGTDWSVGWIAFVDRDGNRQRSIGEPLIGRQPPLPDDVRLIGLAGRQRIAWTRAGSVGSNTSFTLCDRRGPLQAQRLILSNGGRLRIAPADPGAAAACVAGIP